MTGLLVIGAKCSSGSTPFEAGTLTWSGWGAAIRVTGTVPACSTTTTRAGAERDASGRRPIAGAGSSNGVCGSNRVRSATS